MGKLLDNRSKKNKPSFVSLLKKDSQELKELWRTVSQLLFFDI